jgi:hypothetical protein
VQSKSCSALEEGLQGNVGPRLSGHAEGLPVGLKRTKSVPETEAGAKRNRGNHGGEASADVCRRDAFGAREGGG